MGRSPAPVALSPGRLLSARDPPGANKAAESPPPPLLPQAAPPAARPRHRGPCPPAQGQGSYRPGAAKAPPGPRIPQVSEMGRGRGGSRRASHPDGRREGEDPGTRPGLEEITSSSLPYFPPLLSPTPRQGKVSRQKPKDVGDFLLQTLIPLLRMDGRGGRGHSLRKALVYALFVYISFQRYRVPFLDSAGCFRLSLEYTGLGVSCLQPD